VDASVRKEIRSLEIPFDRQKASFLNQYVRLQERDIVPSPVEPEKKDKPTAKAVSREHIDNLLSELFFQVTNIEEIDPEVELTNQGLDSLSGTELISQLAAFLNIEIQPETLFDYPLKDQFVDRVYALLAGARN
jgi:acyl carrier protein